VVALSPAWEFDGWECWQMQHGKGGCQEEAGQLEPWHPCMTLLASGQIKWGPSASQPKVCSAPCEQHGAAARSRECVGLRSPRGVLACVHKWGAGAVESEGSSPKVNAQVVGVCTSVVYVRTCSQRQQEHGVQTPLLKRLSVVCLTPLIGMCVPCRMGVGGHGHECRSKYVCSKMAPSGWPDRC